MNVWKEKSNHCLPLALTSSVPDTPAEQLAPDPGLSLFLVSITTSRWCPLIRTGQWLRTLKPRKPLLLLLLGIWGPYMLIRLYFAFLH